MTAVAQTYPNYLGGLNEQPDEVKKPGQLVEAVNVIPDTTLGLVRREGFELLPWKDSNGTPIDALDADFDGTWFELDFQNKVNEDYLYFGCVKKSGEVAIFNQDGEQQAVRYANEAVKPHKNYLYNSGELEVTDDNGELLQEINTNTFNSNGYFRNSAENPLKYCVSKNQVIFANPMETPTLAQAKEPTEAEANLYYSFLNLKVIDVANYDYKFRRFYSDDITEEYSYAKNIELDSVEDLGDGYDQDLSLPLQTNGPFRFELEPNDDTADIKENAIVDVTFRGQIIQLQSSDSGGYRNEARYSWSVRIVDPGKGFKEGVFNIVMAAPPSDEIADLPDLLLTFRITDANKVTATKNELIVPEELTDQSNAEDILLELAEQFKASGIDKVLVVGSGLYLENSAPFSISTSEIAVADVLNSQKKGNDVVPIVRVNTVAELPVECFAGFKVEVVNSFDEKSNYYLEYEAEFESDSDLTSPLLTKSDGYWKEIAKPFEQTNINNGSMPHMITIARETDQIRFVFIVSPMMYRGRTAGTADDNPSLFVDGGRITEVNYYKNRLFFMTSEGSLISSAAGEIDNMFLDTAIELSPKDPIDLIANSNQRVAIYGSVVVNNAMVLFGDTEQYSLSTNDSLLTSQTASLTKVANFTFDPVSNPIYLGTNLGFISKGEKKFYEMTNVYDRGPVDINERSQQIQRLMATGAFNMPVSSREQSLAIIYKKHDGNGSNRMLVYKFRQETSQQSTLAAWTTWTVPGNICHVSLPRDKMFVVTHTEEDGYKLLRMDPRTTENYYDEYTDELEGVPYESRITFPTIYPRGETTSDYTSNVTIHRIKMSTADIGAYNLIINRMGYDDYNLLIEQPPADEYLANDTPNYKEHIETIPIYTRNNRVKITISSNFNAPLILRSMTWEGDWNQPYYKRV